jgi:hypothetical protein
MAGILLAVLMVLSAAFLSAIRRRIPPELAKDIRAGLAARGITNPDERLGKYLELRYGTLSDPANRQKAFVDFFDPDHIKALHLMVTHGPETQRQANIQATARWVENYRTSLTPQERAALKAQFQSPEGLATLRRATALYNSQDVQYRGQTAPVISELLKTIYGLQTP